MRWRSWVWRILLAGPSCAAIICGGASAADWIIAPSLTFQEVVTDNVDESQNNKRADAISQLIPSLTVTGDGPRGQVAFSYSPTFSAYIAEPGQDRVDQNLLGNGSINILDRLLSVDFNAFANQGSGSGSFGSPGASGIVPLSDRTLNYGGTIAPHLQQRYGDWATLDAFYRVTTSNTTGNDAITSPLGGISNDLLQQEEQIIVGSGNSFNQLTGRLNFDHTTGSGSGINNNYDNDTDVVQFEYHLTHKYSLTGSAGYQSIHYAPTLDSSGYSNAGPTWSVGGKASPNDFTTIELSYGRQSGTYNVEAHVKYDLTPRTHLSADYTVLVENQLQANFQPLQFLTHDPLGNPINGQTGLPYSNIDNQLFGAQNALFRDKIATVSFTRQFTRSSVTATATSEQRAPLSGVSFPDNAWYGTVTYTRELTPDLAGYADIGYSVHSYDTALTIGQQHDRLINADISLKYSITPKLSATATYSFFKRSSDLAGFSSTTNQFMVGIRKAF